MTRLNKYDVVLQDDDGELEQRCLTPPTASEVGRKFGLRWARRSGGVCSRDDVGVVKTSSLLPILPKLDIPTSAEVLLTANIRIHPVPSIDKP